MVLIVEQVADVVGATAAHVTEAQPDTTDAATQVESLPTTGRVAPTAGHPADEVLEEELLVEEISIDGMCGVY